MWHLLASSHHKLIHTAVNVINGLQVGVAGNNFCDADSTELCVNTKALFS